MREGVLLLDYMEKRGPGGCIKCCGHMTEWVHDFHMKLVGFYLERRMTYRLVARG